MCSYFYRRSVMNEVLFFNQSQLYHCLLQNSQFPKRTVSFQNKQSAPQISHSLPMYDLDQNKGKSTDNSGPTWMWRCGSFSLVQPIMRHTHNQTTSYKMIVTERINMVPGFWFNSPGRASNLQKCTSELRRLLRCHIWKMKSTSKDHEPHKTMETVTVILMLTRYQ